MANLQNAGRDEQLGVGRPSEGATTDDALFAAVYPRLRKFAAVVGSAGIEPDDLVQEAVANTLRRHRLVDLDHPLAYLRRAVLNEAMTQQHRRTTQRRVFPRLVSADRQAPSYPSDLGDLDHLTPRDRAILYLVHVEGQTYDATASLLDETPQNARLRASRARKRLRETLAAEAGEASDG